MPVRYADCQKLKYSSAKSSAYVQCLRASLPRSLCLDIWGEVLAAIGLHLGHVLLQTSACSNNVLRRTGSLDKNKKNVLFVGLFTCLLVYLQEHTTSYRGEITFQGFAAIYHKFAPVEQVRPCDCVALK